MTDKKKNLKLSKKIKYSIEYMPIAFLSKTIGILPRKAVVALANFIGFWIFYFPTSYRLITANIKVAFPEKNSSEIRKIGLKSMQSIILMFFESFWFRADSKRIEQYVHLTPEVLDEFAHTENTKTPMLLVVPHLGNWEIVGQTSPYYLSTPMAVVAKKFRNPYLADFISNSRGEFGNIVIDSKGAARQMLKCLKKNMIVCTLIDQNTRVRDGGVFIDFLGLPVPSSKIAAFICKKMPNVKVMVGGGRRTSDGNIISFIKPLPKKYSEYDNDKDFIQDIMTVTGEVIKKYPEQYLWFYKRFQNISPDATEEELARYPYYAIHPHPRFFDGTLEK
ncbi:hypothetical protein AAEX28_08120 [Lentisphaerota bacterium WC36G]|nr:hypothetical protein LJT99_10975 [Lentisphaerae bacterium WC36]